MKRISLPYFPSSLLECLLCTTVRPSADWCCRSTECHAPEDFQGQGKDTEEDYRC